MCIRRVPTSHGSVTQSAATIHSHHNPHPATSESRSSSMLPSNLARPPRRYSHQISGPISQPRVSLTRNQPPVSSSNGTSLYRIEPKQLPFPRIRVNITPKQRVYLQFPIRYNHSNQIPVPTDPVKKNESTNINTGVKTAGLFLAVLAGVLTLSYLLSQEDENTGVKDQPETSLLQEIKVLITSFNLNHEKRKELLPKLLEKMEELRGLGGLKQWNPLLLNVSEARAGLIEFLKCQDPALQIEALDLLKYSLSKGINPVNSLQELLFLEKRLGQHLTQANNLSQPSPVLEQALKIYQQLLENLYFSLRGVGNLIPAREKEAILGRISLISRQLTNSPHLQSSGYWIQELTLQLQNNQAPVSEFLLANLDLFTATQKPLSQSIEFAKKYKDTKITDILIDLLTKGLNTSQDDIKKAQGFITTEAPQIGQRLTQAWNRLQRSVGTETNPLASYYEKIVLLKMILTASPVTSDTLKSLHQLGELISNQDKPEPFLYGLTEILSDVARSASSNELRQQAIVEISHLISFKTPRQVHNKIAETVVALEADEDLAPELKALIDKQKAALPSETFQQIQFWYQAVGQSKRDLAARLEGWRRMHLPENLSSIPLLNQSRRVERALPREEIALNFRSFDQNTLIQIIEGLSGTGKTQVALDYASHYKRDYNKIYYFDATDNTVLLSQLANEFKFSPAETPSQQLAHIKNWLEQHSGWLLILEGFNPNTEELKQLKQWLPSKGGHVLIPSSTASRWKDSLDVHHTLELGPFSERQAVQFLMKTTQHDDSNGALQIAQALGFLPIALTTATQYINRVRIDFQGYLKRLEVSKAELLKRHYTSSQNSLLAHWSLQFEAVQKETPLAMEFLNFCAYLHSERIPEEFLVKWIKKKSPEGSILDLDTLKKTLLDHSLIQTDKTGSLYYIHPLIQEALQARQTGAQKNDHLRQALQLMTPVLSEYDSLDSSFLSTMNVYLPHAMSIATKAELEGLEPEQIAKTYEQTGFYFYERNNYEEAYKNYEKAFKLRQKQKDSQGMSTSLRHLGDTLVRQGKLRLAYDKYDQALSEVQKDKNPFEYAYILNGQGKALTRLRRPDDAQKKHEEALRVLRQSKGNERLEATTLYHLGIALETKGTPQDLSNAEKALTQSLKIRRQLVSSQDNREVSDSIYYLGNVYYKQKNYTKALENHQESLNIRQKIYENTPNAYTAASLYYLSKDYYKLKDFAKAEQLQLQALKIRETLYRESPNRELATSYYELGKIYSRVEKLPEAEQFLEKAFQTNHSVDQKDQGQSSPASFGSIFALYQLGKTLDAQKKREEALKKYQTAFDLAKKGSLSENHPLMQKIKRRCEECA